MKLCLTSCFPTSRKRVLAFKSLSDVAIFRKFGRSRGIADNLQKEFNSDRIHYLTQTGYTENKRTACGLVRAKKT